MAKHGCELIAEHFGMDIESVRDQEYQPGKFSKPVYFVNDLLWAGGKLKPKDYSDTMPRTFERVISSYDGRSILWREIERSEKDLAVKNG